MSSLLVMYMAAVLPELQAATFDGNSRVEAQDPSGSLSWSNSINALTVSCWFKLSVPTTVNLTQNMTILVNRRDGDENSIYAYLLRYNIYSGNIEFVTKGSSGIYTNTLIRSPYLDRWYHVAMVRNGAAFMGYVDGNALTPDAGAVGDSGNVNGLTVGGWGGTKFLYGEVQEVAIYQSALSGVAIRDRLYKEQSSYAGVKGYYKLSYSTNTAVLYNNFVLNPPLDTSPAVKQGSGSVTFEEVDQGGEQSTFDSRKNKGEDALAPLSGAFAWDQVVFARPTPGIAFEFKIGYSSANQYAGAIGGDVDPYETRTLSKGWRHSFDARIIPNQSSTDRNMLNWDGSIENWVKTSGVYKTRHKEYRGELVELGNGDFEWVTPDRIIYHFRDPTLVSMMDGRLYEILDYNSNAVHVLWNEGDAIVTQVVDSANGVYTFNYNPQLFLTNITFQGWSVNFSFDASNRLVGKTLSGPAAYSNLNTCWAFSYNASNGLLDRVYDPRSNCTASVSYDKYYRKVLGWDAVGRTNKTEYGVPGTRQLTHTDPAGFKWVESFDRKGRVLSQKDPLNNTISYTYDDAGNRISVIEPLGWTTFLGYDSRANLTVQTNALGLVKRWDYHPFFNKPTNEVNEPGWSTYMVYDTRGNLVSNFDGIGSLATYVYFTNGLVQTTIDGNGNATRFTYTIDGFLSSKTDPASNTWTYGRNELGWTVAETNALGQVTTYFYDINGNVIKLVDPLPRTFTKVYDPNGNQSSGSDGKGLLTYSSYDAANQKTQQIDRVGAQWRYTYTSRGQQEATIDPYLNVVSNTYDSANRLVMITDPFGGVISNTYNANGKVNASFDKTGQKWSKTYDRLNRVTSETDPLGNTKTTTFDVAGRVKVITTPNGYPSTHEYDGRGRLRDWTDAEGYVWHYDYDGVANITNITDALNGHYVMTYGVRNERVLERNQDGFQWRYQYDPLMRLQSQIDPNGTIRTNEYDNASRLKRVVFSSGRRNVLTYDKNNNPLSLSRTGSGPDSSTTLTFDGMDRIATCQDEFANTIEYRYDLLGRGTNLVYPDGKVLRQSFDALGRLTNQTDWTGRQLTYSYDKADRLIRRTYPNGITQTNSFDLAGRLSDLQYLISSNNPLIALSYAYDKNGNKTSGTEKGTLDWTVPATIDETARYTASGRLIDRVDAADTNRDFVYRYDPSGNMTNAVGADQSFGFTYDEDNRVMTLHWVWGVMTDRFIQNHYDALGRRIARTADATETRYVLDLAGKMERVLCDVTGAGVITAWYVHGPDLCYRIDQTNGLTCYHADAQGNIITLTGGAKNTLAQYAYTPYGRSLPGSTSDANPYRFVGSQGVMEELPNLYFMRARYYSAEAGVFLSTDPVKKIGPGWKPQAYDYATENPLSGMDPKGESVLAYYMYEQTYLRSVEDGLSVAEDITDVYAGKATQDTKYNIGEVACEIFGGTKLLCSGASRSIEAAQMGVGHVWNDFKNDVKDDLVSLIPGVIEWRIATHSVKTAVNILEGSLARSPMAGAEPSFVSTPAVLGDPSAGGINGRQSKTGGTLSIGGSSSLPSKAVTSFSSVTKLNSVQSIIPKQSSKIGGVTTPSTISSGNKSTTASSAKSVATSSSTSIWSSVVRFFSSLFGGKK